MNEFTASEIKFLNSLEECRVATCHDNIPHVKPVSYLFDNNLFYIATDYETRMYQNLKINSRIALSIDIYNPSKHKAICIQGTAKIIERGGEFKKIYDKFFKKFEWVRKQPWEENEAPFIQIKPITKLSWGLE